MLEKVAQKVDSHSDSFIGKILDVTSILSSLKIVRYYKYIKAILRLLQYGCNSELRLTYCHLSLM